MTGVPELVGGPYITPHVKAGDWLDDEIGGSVQVGGYTTGRIPWPRRKKTGRPSLILCGDLARAVRLESVVAVRYYFGVGATTVWMWREALGIDRINPGTTRRLRLMTGVPSEAAARGREAAKDPAAVAKMAETKRGKPAHPNTSAALLRTASQPKPPGWGRRASEWMRKGK